MYRRLGSKHLFQKLDGSSSLPECDLAKMTGSIRFLYYSLSYVNLFKDRLSLSLSLSRRMLCSEKRVQRYGIFFIPSKCFERKVCESWRFFALFYKIRVKIGYFWGNDRKKGIFREHDHLVMEAACEAKWGHIVGKRCLGGAKQGQENRGNGARRTETRVSYDWEAIFSLLYIAQERRKWPLRA